ncbi:MAG: gamma-glutamyltransferase [Vicinamibacterales bacterium]
MKRRVPLVIASVASLFFAPAAAQGPGDRPAPNPRATRSVVLARDGLIATSQPLASAAGLQVLQEGGNAIDAAVTAAAVLAVVEPTMNGIGGDLFAIVHDGKTKSLHALNASGRSPRAATPEAFASRSLKEMPRTGILSASVPGVVDGWSELLAKYGTISLARALRPAIHYARNGYAVSDIISANWATVEALLARDADAAATFLPGGHAPAPGQIFANPNLARTLEQIAAGGRDAFYRGPIAAAIVAASKKRNGLFELNDFAEQRVDWVDPISASYRGFDVYEMPPNTQGATVLEMLNILEGYDLRQLGHNSAAYIHVLTEAKKIAYADRDAYLADPDAVPPALLRTLISKEYAAVRRKEIDMTRAARSVSPGRIAGVPSGRQDADLGYHVEGRDHGDTIYLTAADGKGNMISLIQSLFDEFGSGVVAGDTGIALQNRASLFTLTPGHPNRIAPRKRPFHTLIPAMVMKDGQPWLSFGVMGGDMQPQGHVQVLANLIDFGMNIQDAGESARFRHMNNGVALESVIAALPDVIYGLSRRGQRTITGVDLWGGFQGVLRDPRSGVLQGGSDPRKDGLAIGY